MTRRSYEESRIQKAIVTHFRKTYAGKICAVPNGGYRNILEAIRLKEEGVEAGHPDLIIYCKAYRIFLMEVKQPGGALSDAQKKFIPELEAAAFEVVVVESLEEAKQAFIEWQLPLKVARERSAAEIRTGF